MYQVRVYGKNRDIPWTHNKRQSHIHLIAGSPKLIEDEDLVDHLRKFNLPEKGRGIEITEIDAKTKSVRSMSLLELRELADSMDVEYADSDSRMDIMKKIRGEKNG